jgi:hypothetical protein
MSSIDTSVASTGLTEAEERLIADIDTWLKETSPEDCKQIDLRFSHLRGFGRAVFAYPSIRDTQFLKGIIRDEGHLTESLLAFSPSSRVLHIPTKVVAIRSFLVAKFHAFSLLSYLSGDNETFQAELRTVIFSVVSTLITEEVYFSCLADPGFSNKTKTSLADDLIALWDSGVDLRGIRHLSALSSLWLAREAAPPSFGTMDGNTELLRITIDLDDDWRDFLMVEASNTEARWALEEFLFGLSWEEIKEVRSTLTRFGITAVNYDQIRSYLDSKPAYSVVNEKDPRAFYDFFIERRDACAFRKKIFAPGPRHTLEEIYLKDRIITELR